MPLTSNGSLIASVDRARRSLLLLGVLLYPLSDERAALGSDDAEGYLKAVSARIRGICSQARAIVEHSLEALAWDGVEVKSRRGRRKGQPADEMPQQLAEELERIFAECELPNALERLRNSRFPGEDFGQPLDELVKLAARTAAVAVRLSVTAARQINPVSTAAAEDTELATAVVSGTVRAAHRIASVLDQWDMQAGSPTEVIGCQPPPGVPLQDFSSADLTQLGSRSLGVAAALAVAGEQAPSAGSPRRTRSDTVWSTGGAVARD